jgi:spermidine synthase
MAVLALRISLLVMGLSGIVAQILLLRELLVSFQGNELTLGVILANWLLLEAVGSFAVGRSVEKTERKREIYVVVQLLFSVALPTALFLSRFLKGLLSLTPGEAVGLSPVFCSSLLILLPVAIPHGALFTYGSKLYSQFSTEDSASIGKVYILETIGTILGGLGLTYFFIPNLNPFEIVFVVSLINSLISALLLWPRQKPSSSSFGTTFWAFSLFLSLLYGMGLFCSFPKTLHDISIRSQWKGMGVVYSENSIYGNITVTKKEEQFTFFANGAPVITAPFPDVAFVEDFVHFPMLLHENPRSILILSGGAGGIIHEILKYPLSRIEYAELDPLLLKLVGQFSTPLTQSELSSPNVRVHHLDGRYFTLRTPERFDLIFIGAPAPQDLQENRLFSSEFFSITKQKMNPDGILVLFLPGSLTYMSKELGDLNACILDTLRANFPCVRVIPGDTNLYLASNSIKLASVTVDQMAQRLEARHITTRLITRNYLADRLDDRWLKWFSQSLQERKPRINSDLHPLGLFFSLSHWNALFSPYLGGVFRGFEAFGIRLPLAALLAATLLLALVFYRKPSRAIHSLSYAIFTTGLSGMVFSLAIIFSFQTFCGYLYHEIGLLIAVFMAGIASGSLLTTRTFIRAEAESFLFLGTELAILLFSLILPMFFFPLVQLLQASESSGLLEGLFWIAAFLSGMLTGLQFPLATRIYLRLAPAEGVIGRTAALIYGVDLIGGFMGGLLGGVLFLPILGMKETCFLMAMMKISSLALFVFYLRLCKQPFRMPS